MKIVNNKGLYKNFKINSDEKIKFNNYFIENKIVDGSEYVNKVNYRTQFSYYIEFDGANDALFYLYNINRRSFQARILGYSNNGGFPFCRTKEDALKLLDELLSAIKGVKIIC